MSREIGREPDVHPTGLLPLYVNGTLHMEMRAEIESHLRSCPDCRRELIEWEGLAAAVREEPIQMPDPARAWNRLRERRERDEGASTHETAKMAGLRAWLAWRPLPPLAWGLAAVQLLLILGLALYIAMGRMGREDARPWTTLAGPGVGGVEEGARLQIIFREEARAGEIAALLESVEGQIVRGPSGQGAYLVAVPRRAVQEKGLSPIIDAIASRQDIVMWVQHEKNW